MHILNVMLSSGSGGIESAFADYAAMLLAEGHHRVTCCTVPQAHIVKRLPEKARWVVLKNSSQFDPMAVLRAGAILRKEKPHVIITHGKRAFQLFALARRLFARDIKLVNVLHRHRYKDLKAADCIITVSRTIREEAIRAGIPENRVVHIPNALMTVPEATPRPFPSVPVIGALGRFVPEKGVDIFLEALGILRTRNSAFRVCIAGDGALKQTLHQQSEKLGLAGVIEWLGWVDDVPAFYESIDIFCLPSRAESFGLAVLGAMAHAKPVVATRTIGPSEFLVHESNALLCDISASALADGLAAMLAQPEKALKLAAAARETALRYSADNVGKQIGECLNTVVI
jgi:glycosyltransferase involved in cell wall biosynthesis